MLELQRNLVVIRRWWWLLVIATVAGAVVAFGLTKLLVQQQYEGTAMISMVPGPQSSSGNFVTMLSATADAQLVPTEGTAAAVITRLPALRGEQAAELVKKLSSDASPDGQLLYVHAEWTSPGLASRLTNTVASVFIGQERRRLASRYALIHRNLSSQEQHLQRLIRSVSGAGQAQNWLQSQYALTASRIYQEDADAAIQSQAEQRSLALAQPATSDGTVKVGPKATVNALLGAVLALLAALVFAYAGTREYGDAETASARTILTPVGD